MILEELIAKLGFKVSGQSEAQKFLRQLDALKKTAKDTNKSFKLNLTGSASGLNRMVSDLERGIAAVRRFRRETAKPLRVDVAGRGYHVHPRDGRGGRRPGGGRTVVPAGEGYGPAGGAAGGYAAGRLIGMGGPAVTAAGVAATGVVALKKFGDLETAGKQLAITAEKTYAEIAPDIEMFRKEGPKIGALPKDMASVAQAFIAAGLTYEQAIGAVIPTVKAAKASFTSLDDAAGAGIATMQNLKIGVNDLEAAYDFMIKGGKLGKAEFNEMAGVMPQLAASASKIGEKDLKGLASVVAAMEVVRETGATTPDSGIHLKDLYEKMSAPDVARHFKKKGVDLEAELKAGDKTGKSRMDTFLDIMQRVTKGDPFRIAEVLHEQQSRDAATTLLKNRDKFNQYRDDIMKNARGTTATDFAEATNSLQASFDRLLASADRLAGRFGEMAAPAARKLMDSLSESTDKSENATKADGDALLRDFGVLPPKSTWVDPPTRQAPQARSPFGGLHNRMRWGGVGTIPGGIDPGDLTKRFGADWMRQGTQQTAGTVQHTINNTNTGNDQRTQSVTVNQTVNGVPAAASGAAESVAGALSKMGASLAKANSVPTAGSTAP